ncbi:MAG: (d)CMP kinase [Eubacteriales bacterium]|nr:(d)CMP kinase [Eubacteriales bacterium]
MKDIKHISVAIDGPSGVGKSTIAKLLSQELGFVYIDTGAMFRTLAVHVLDKNTRLSDCEQVERAIEDADIVIRYIGGTQHMLLNGEDVTDRLRTERVSAAASVISQYPKVRQTLLHLQRSIAEKEDVIMDGRDIGTVVLPDADVKIFLTAAPEIRAQRRFDQLKAAGKLEGALLEDILRDQRERDYRDSNREAAPLRAAEDAVLIDTSLLSADEVKTLICSEIRGIG